MLELLKTISKVSKKDSPALQRLTALKDDPSKKNELATIDEQAIRLCNSLSHLVEKLVAGEALSPQEAAFLNADGAQAGGNSKDGLENVGTSLKKAESNNKTSNTTLQDVRSKFAFESMNNLLSNLHLFNGTLCALKEEKEQQDQLNMLMSFQQSNSFLPAFSSNWSSQTVDPAIQKGKDFEEPEYLEFLDIICTRWGEEAAKESL
eukprot:TRINITY_DN2459_c0_g1_i1.p1 TRINITY_DN2459_c0_g1~~TRINITY_DN2459_c0_g1_i1.p1  ORF type:complete len:206 (+),score=56.69 TRINITY_DN2459_c0_g1_i1:62-679(+)